IPSALASSTPRHPQSLHHKPHSARPALQNGSPAGSIRTAGQPWSPAPTQENLPPAPHCVPHSTPAHPPGSHTPQSHPPQSPDQHPCAAPEPSAPAPSNPPRANPSTDHSCAQLPSAPPQQSLLLVLP